MDEILNTYVAFRGDFTFPNSLLETAPGEELADLLVEGLPDYGISAALCDEPDIAQYVDCIVDGVSLDLMVGGEPDEIVGGILWFIMLTQTKRGWRKIDVEAERSACRTLLFAIDQILQGCRRIRDVRWYPQFDAFVDREWMLPSPGPVRDPELDEHLLSLFRLESRLFHPAVNMIAWPGLIILVAYTGPEILLGILSWLWIGSWFVGPVIMQRLMRRAAERRLVQESNERAQRRENFDSSAGTD